jgi:hypothetical protein
MLAWAAVWAVQVSSAGGSDTGKSKALHGVDTDSLSRRQGSSDLSDRGEAGKIPENLQSAGAVWRPVVRAAAQGALACHGNEVDSNRHCICPPPGPSAGAGGWKCVGSGCVVGHSLSNGTVVQGYKKG